MKNTLTKHFVLLLTMLTFALCGSSASAAVANVVRFSQGDTIAAMSGGTLTVDVVGENFASLAPDGAAFSLSWNPSVLQFLSTSFTNPLWNFKSADASNAGAGVIDPVLLGISTLNVNAGADFGLASFSFNVVGNPGDQTELALGIDVYGIGFINGLTALNVNYVNSQVQVVPLPASAWLFGTALLGLGNGRLVRRGRARGL